ncbi:MAG: zinc ribbon domain-containing protein [Candidatus Peribacteraceae bacterium]|nr:zinc ribbon domain-containing protein [Candidatus Peribacteraceae bacterium]
MPTFDFTCSACQAQFEFSRPFGSTQKPRCPACGSRKTEKQITPPAIHFKGTGFFVTDSRKQKEKTEKKEEKPKEAKTEKKEAPAEGAKAGKKREG